MVIKLSLEAFKRDGSGEGPVELTTWAQKYFHARCSWWTIPCKMCHWLMCTWISRNTKDIAGDVCELPGEPCDYWKCARGTMDVARPILEGLRSAGSLRQDQQGQRSPCLYVCMYTFITSIIEENIQFFL